MNAGNRKQFILDEIIRTARENGGTPLGHRRFYKETGIREFDWRGKYWRNFGEAVREAGFVPNRLTKAYDKTFLLEKLISVVRKLGRFPTVSDFALEKNKDKVLPNYETFRRLGPKNHLVQEAFDFCKARSGNDDVAAILSETLKHETSTRHPVPDRQDGFVYLQKMGQFYKIGRTNSVERRNRELRILLPEPLDVLHVIQTDDPTGIEAYWLKRFEAKRARGEWFNLTTADVRAFKRRRFM